MIWYNMLVIAVGAVILLSIWHCLESSAGIILMGIITYSLAQLSREYYAD